MKEHFENALTYLKELEDIDACITGSAMLGYIEGAQQDIDVFCYTEAAFTKLIYTLKFNPMCLLLDKREIWKFEDFTKSNYKTSIKKLGLITIKFYYNQLIPINVIYKEKCNNIFQVLESFDMDLITIGIDLLTKKTLDLSNGAATSKIVSWNRWNKSFYNPSLWACSRILRQFLRIQKYTDRGYDCSAMAHKYIEILEGVIDYENIFESEKMEEKINSIKVNGKLLIQIINKWLEVRKLTAEETTLINDLIKNL